MATRVSDGDNESESESVTVCLQITKLCIVMYSRNALSFQKLGRKGIESIILL